ncbi:MAG TPA: L,D-transpeptidase [Longimicrobium sp.]|nr:L,D-transpeptidase [Longimicrobium sp.]
MRSTHGFLLRACVPALFAVPIALDLSAQSPRRRAEPARPEVQAGGLRVRSQALARGGYAVIVDLDANRLHFAKGRRILWSAPVGTGTGMRLETRRGEWDFATPNGTFHVVYKEREPDWIAPDWYFIENGLPVPPPSSDARRFARGLGSAAVFIGQGLAIHGTDKPELLGQRVSHGCIRLANDDALRLFHNVQVGTEIVIVGGRNAEPAPPRQASSSRRSSSRSGPPPRDPFIVELEEQDTGELLARLDDELFAAVAARGADTRWHQVASVLLFRGAKEGDDEALGGLLSRVEDLGGGALRDEYATFIADAYNQGPLRVIGVLASLDRDTRSVVARALVESALALYPGNPTDVAAPWPTRRAPRTAVRRNAVRGWDALQLAEDAFRERSGLAMRGGSR